VPGAVFELAARAQFAAEKSNCSDRESLADFNPSSAMVAGAWYVRLPVLSESMQSELAAQHGGFGLALLELLIDRVEYDPGVVVVRVVYVVED
jgi:hypothetical protein